MVASIPSDRNGLWEYPVYWEALDNVRTSPLNPFLTLQSIVEGKIRPFATKKIIEAFGIQEQDLIDFVVQHISNHGSAESLAKELEMVCIPLRQANDSSDTRRRSGDFCQEDVENVRDALYTSFSFTNTILGLSLKLNLRNEKFPPDQ